MVVTLPSLSVKFVSKSFDGNLVLRNVSFTAREGEILGIIGPNGAGKTTLLNIISGFLKPDTGKVTLGERDITGLKPHIVRGLGVVRSFQIPKHAKNLTVLENVLVSTLFKRKGIGLKEAKVRCAQVLEQLGLGDQLDHYPVSLPAAGFRKIELARILVSDARVALFDEVTAGLSEDEREGIIRAIRGFQNTRRILIVVDHVLPTIMDLCSRVIVLDRGVVIADGKPEDALSSRLVIESYLGELKYVTAK
jgi:ABC-type branched-subunit amino acid transport system ATPase component